MMADKYSITTLADGDHTNTANYVGSVAPAANDNMFYQYAASQPLAGSDQSGIELDNIEVLPTCFGGAGSADTYLQLDQGAANGVIFAGSGVWYLDMGGAGSASVRVDRTANASNGNAGLYFKNDTAAITSFEVNGGVVRLVAANITTLVVRSGATVYIDAASTVVTVVNDGGTVIDYGAAVTTWNQKAGTGTRYGSDVYAANIYGGTLYNDGTGTATVVQYGGLFDSERDNRAKSVTLRFNGGSAKIGPGVTLTETLNTSVTISA